MYRQLVTTMLPLHIITNKKIHQGPILLTLYNFSPASISDHRPFKVLYEITYPSLNFNVATVMTVEV